MVSHRRDWSVTGGGCQSQEGTVGHRRGLSVTAEGPVHLLAFTVTELSRESTVSVFG